MVIHRSSISPVYAIQELGLAAIGLILGLERNPLFLTVNQSADFGDVFDVKVINILQESTHFFFRGGLLPHSLLLSHLVFRNMAKGLRDVEEVVLLLPCACHTTPIH